MPNSYPDQSPGIWIPKVKQITDAHCGPAVIEMLLAYLGISVSQKALVQTVNAESMIDEYGMRVEQLAEAVSHLFPQVNFLFKNNATLGDLKELVLTYNYPVGVEWQGIFDLDDEEESDDQGDDDPGHYSVVTNVDENSKTIVLADPYKSYSLGYRMIPIYVFLNRWWDTNIAIDEVNKEEKTIKDYHMIFLITPNNVIFPKNLKLEKYAFR
jgi:hypothetical protein